MYRKILEFILVSQTLIGELKTKYFLFWQEIFEVVKRVAGRDLESWQMVTSLIRPTWIWHSLLKYFPPSQLQSQVSCQSKQKLKNILRKDIWRHQAIHSEVLSFHIQYWQQHLFLNKKISKVKSRTIYFSSHQALFIPGVKVALIEMNCFLIEYSMKQFCIPLQRLAPLQELEQIFSNYHFPVN